MGKPNTGSEAPCGQKWTVGSGRTQRKRAEGCPECLERQASVRMALRGQKGGPGSVAGRVTLKVLVMMYHQQGGMTQ